MRRTIKAVTIDYFVVDFGDHDPAEAVADLNVEEPNTDWTLVDGEVAPTTETEYVYRDGVLEGVDPDGAIRSGSFGDDED